MVTPNSPSSRIWLDDLGGEAVLVLQLGGHGMTSLGHEPPDGLDDLGADVGIGGVGHRRVGVGSDMLRTVHPS